MTHEKTQRLGCKFSNTDCVGRFRPLTSCSYQRIYFRNANHPMSRTSVVSRRQEGRSAASYISRSIEQEEAIDADRRWVFCEILVIVLKDPVSRKSHIFDGVTLTKETAAFQLCDIHDPMLKEMIEDEDDLREVCDVSTHIYPGIPISYMT